MTGHSLHGTAKECSGSKWCTVCVYCWYNYSSFPDIHLQTLKGDVICSTGQRLSLKLTLASDVGQPVAAKLMSTARYDIRLASRASLALWSLACECVRTPWFLRHAYSSTRAALMIQEAVWICFLSEGQVVSVFTDKCSVRVHMLIKISLL